MPETPAEIEELFLTFLGDDPKSPRQIVNQMTKLLAKDAKSAKALTARAWANFELDDFDAAIADATKAIRLCPQSYLPWHIRGASYFCTMEPAKAEVDLTEAIRLADGVKLFLESAYMYRGGVRSDALRLDEALADLNRCLKIHPEQAWGYLFRGYTYSRKQEYRKALKDLERAISLSDNDPQALAALAWLLATCPDDKLRDGKRALKLAKRANENSGDSHLDELAAACAELGDFPAAVKAAKRSVKNGGDPKEQKQRERRLKLYESQQPCRRPWDD